MSGGGIEQARCPECERYEQDEGNRESSEVVVMTQDLRFYAAQVKDGEVVAEEKKTALTETLKEMHCGVWEVCAT